MQPDALAALVEGIVKAAVAPVVARLAALELKADMSTAADGALVAEIAGLKRAAEAVTVEAGLVRERIAVVEVKALQPGPPGPPGLSVEAFDVTLEPDGRTLAFTLGHGDAARVARVKAPWLLNRGVYHDGTPYEAGDVVTWDGSAFVCLEATTSLPSDGGRSWRLIVKRGRDGRDTRAK